MNTEDIFKTIGTVASKQKTDIFVVGGYVRDQLLGRGDTKDLDFVVDGSGIGFAKVFFEQFDAENVRLIEFPDFDTARVLFVEERARVIDRFDEPEPIPGVEKKSEEQVFDIMTLFEVEFAGARKETYDSASRKPKVVATSIEDDLSRRDFTVNAMAQKVLADGNLGDVIDPFGGQKDLETRTLRTPLDPNETFSDDPLRMMRAARFASQLIFEIEQKTYMAMKRNAVRLKIVSQERIQEELMKLLATVKPSIGLWILYKTELFDQFMPEVSDLAGVEEVAGYSHKDNLSHTFAVVDNIAEQSDNTLLRFAGLMHDIAKPSVKQFEKGRGWTFDMHEHLGRKMVREIGTRFRMSKRDIEYVAKLVRWHLQPIAVMDKKVTDAPVRRLVVNLKHDLQELLYLCRADITTGNQKKKEHRLRNYDILEQRIREVMAKDKLRAFQSPLRGEEIMELCGLKAGPTVGKIKKRIEDAILDGEIPNEYASAKVFFDRIKDEYVNMAGEWEKL